MKSLFICLLSVASYSLADEVILKTGFKIMNVQFIDSTQEYITVLTKARERKIPTENVVQIIIKRFDLSFDSLTDSISSSIDYPPSESEKQHDVIIQKKDSANQKVDRKYDKIIFLNGRITEGKISIIKPDIVAIEDSETGISFEYLKSEIDKIITSSGKILTFVQSSNNSSNNTSNQIYPLSQDINERLMYIQPFIGISSPQGDFASSDLSNTKAGFAQAGYTVGLEVVSVVQPNTQLQFSISYNSNAFNGSMFNGKNISIGNYNSFNFLGGLRFITINNGNRLRFYMGTKLGLFVGKFPTIESYNISISSNNATAFAYNINGGAIIENTIDVSVQYLSMTPKYKLSSNQNNNNSISGEVPNNLLIFTIGYIINKK